MMEVWGWPQWVLFGWWCFVLTIQFGAVLSDVKVAYKKIAVQQISIAVMAFVLYMGGFWT